jgi:hypothetical protein
MILLYIICANRVILHYRLTRYAIILFEKFSSGDLRLDLESDILKYTRSNLTWNSVKILLETEFNQKNKNSDSDRVANKEKALSDINIKKRLNLNWKDCKKLFPIFDKCPNFALRRLKVIFSYSNMINVYLNP